MIHPTENNSESQNHLDANLDKFKGDAKIVMQLLFSGKRLTGRVLETVYGIDSRRLRDVIKARPDIVKKCWVKDESNKTKFMEYFIEPFKPPTKTYLQEWWDEFLLNDKPKPQLIQGSLL